MSGPAQLSEQELLEYAARGDGTAWERLVDLYAPMIWRLVSSYELSESDTADVIRTTWLRFLERIEYIKAGRVRFWLAATIRQACERRREQALVQLWREEARRQQELEKAQVHQPKIRRVRHHAVSPQRLTNLAAFLAGPKRSSMLDEWRSHLSGEIGQGLTRKDQIRAARGFLLAAARYRIQDAAALAWRPVEGVLRSRILSNLFVLIPAMMAALLILRHEGTLGVVTSAESISAIGGGLYALVRVGRWWRDVRPPEPKARRVGEH